MFDGGQTATAANYTVFVFTELDLTPGVSEKRWFCLAKLSRLNERLEWADKMNDDGAVTLPSSNDETESVGVDRSVAEKLVEQARADGVTQTTSSDIFALGVLGLLCCTGNPMTEDARAVPVIERAELIPQVDKSIDPFLQGLLRQATRPNPKDRVTAKQLQRLLKSR